MYKKAFTLIGIILAGCMLLLSFLQMGYLKRRSPKNGFVRLFHYQTILLSRGLDLFYNSYYIAGNTEERIYLGNSTAPLHIWQCTPTLRDSQSHELALHSGGQFLPTSLHLGIDSPYFYLTNGSIPAIYRGNLAERKIDTVFPGKTYFISATMISTSSLIFRSVNGSFSGTVLGKERFDTPCVRLVKDLLPRQENGLFSTDGMLHYAKQISRMVFVYHYTNRFICADTNLNLIYKGLTIDTNSFAKVKVAKIASEHSFVLAEPPLLVNKKSCVYRHWLLIQSGLRADNENQVKSQQASVIDVYDLLSGKYSFSFYIPDGGKGKIRDIAMIKGYLFELNDHYIYSFQLNPKDFPP